MLYAELRPRDVLKDVQGVLSPYVGYMYSEKYDGWRGLWIGTRQRMTTRSGKREYSLPQAWRDVLPRNNVVLDGEIFIPGESATTVASLLRDSKHPLWKKATFRVFDVFSASGTYYTQLPFRSRYKKYRSIVGGICKKYAKKHKGRCPVVAVTQHKATTIKKLHSAYTTIVNRGGEGVVITDPESVYEHRRVGKRTRVKYKGRADTEGKVLGYNLNRSTNTLRSLRVAVKGKPNVQFSLGVGFSRSDRKNYRSVFPIGTEITFSYRSNHTSGVPKEARFVAVRRRGRSG